MRDEWNCQLFVEMHNFLIIKTLSVLISASGVSLCWGSTRVVWSRIAGVPGFLPEGFFLYPLTPISSTWKSRRDGRKIRLDDLWCIWTKTYGKENNNKKIYIYIYVLC